MGVVRNCCPNCGGAIEVSALYQYSYVYKVLKNGKVSERYTKRDEGPLEVSVAGCINNETCKTTWDEGEFEIRDGLFIDEKYIDEE